MRRGVVFLSGETPTLQLVDDDDDELGNGAKFVSRAGIHNDGGRPRGQDDGDGARGRELQSYNAGEEKRRARAGDRWNLQIPQTSELFRLLLVGFGQPDRVGQQNLSGRVRGGAVEVLQVEDRK